MQGVGIVASVGDSVNHVRVGTPVALMTFGSYAEFTLVLHFVFLLHNKLHTSLYPPLI
jgi:NADPH:quinone reductase-like Zn-dependent oxidoreductase